MKTSRFTDAVHQIMPHGESPKCIGFLNAAQSHELAESICALLNRGEPPEVIEQEIKDFLRELPEGTIAKHGWQVDTLAELLTIAACLAGVVYRNRPHHG